MRVNVINAEPRKWLSDRYDATAMAAAYGCAEQFDGGLRVDEISNIVRNYWRENVAVSYNCSDMEGSLANRPRFFIAFLRWGRMNDEF